MLSIGAANSLNFGALKIKPRAKEALKNASTEKQSEIDKGGEQMKDYKYSDVILQDNLDKPEVKQKNSNGFYYADSYLPPFKMEHDLLFSDLIKLTATWNGPESGNLKKGDTSAALYRVKDGDIANSLCQKMDAAKSEYNKAVVVAEMLEKHGEFKDKLNEVASVKNKVQDEGANNLMDKYGVDE